LFSHSEQGYNANVLLHATTVGAPVIQVADVVSGKPAGKCGELVENKFNELQQYQKLMEEYVEQLVYSAVFV
jgi:hypothetical protein